MNLLNINTVVKKFDEIKELLNGNMFDILFLGAKQTLTVLFLHTLFYTQDFVPFAKIVRRGLEVCLPGSGMSPEHIDA